MLTVSMATWETPQLRRAVDGVLHQTFEDLTLIVVADGDDPWHRLADIEDPRLVRFQLDENRGRYYADKVTLLACDTEFWSPHDSDDWSDPTRFEKQVALDADVSFVECVFHHLEGDTTHDPVRSFAPRPNRMRTIARYPAGVYRTDTARSIGIHPWVRGSFDTAFTSLAFKAFSPQVVREPLYHVHRREGSLTTTPETAHKTDWRREQQAFRRRLYQKAWRLPPEQWARVMTGAPGLEAAVAADVERLKGLLTWV